MGMAFAPSYTIVTSGETGVTGMTVLLGAFLCTFILVIAALLANDEDEK